MSDSVDTPSPIPPVQEPRVAETPFNDMTADVILRTSNKVDFYLYRVILSLASPFFKDMFSLPQSKPAFDASIEDGSTALCPIVDIPEDSRTMDFVLRFCYPIRKPNMTELNDIAPVLLAACKYDMNAALDIAKVALEQCIEQDILGAFAVACRCELYDVCSKAAAQFAHYPFLSLDSEKLDYINADRYHQVLYYHQCCSKDKDFVIPPRGWSSSLPWDEQRPVSSPPSTTPSSPPRNFSPALPRDADTPFDEGGADTVLRSSDQVDFHVHSLILSSASSVFKGMIRDHQQAQAADIRSGDEQAKPPLIIDVQEDSRTLDIVLRRCYPAHVPRLETLSDARLVLAAALKYDIDVVRAHAAAALTELAEQDIIAAWSIALHYRLRDVCAVAARRTLQHHRISLSSAELRYIPARQYHALLQYHKRCGAAAADVVSSRTWFEAGMSLSDAPSRSQQCSACCVPDLSGDSGWYAPSSFWKFLEAARAVLKDRPYSLLVLSDEVMGKWRATRCSYNCVSSRKFGRDTVTYKVCSRIYERG